MITLFKQTHNIVIFNLLNRLYFNYMGNQLQNQLHQKTISYNSFININIRIPNYMFECSNMQIECNGSFHYLNTYKI